MTIVEVLAVLMSILLAVFFAMAEFSILSSRRNLLEQLEAKGSSGARVAIELAEKPVRFLSAVQVVTTLCTMLVTLDQFRETPVNEALVVDEFGNLQGIVTRTDLLEAVAGDLPKVDAESARQKLAGAMMDHS